MLSSTNHHSTEESRNSTSAPVQKPDICGFLNSYSDLAILQHPSLFDSLDIQSLPSLMSSDPSLRGHLSDSVEDDEDESDVYDIFSSPSQRQSRVQQQQQQLQQQQLTQQQLQHHHQQQQQLHFLQHQHQHYVQYQLQEQQRLQRRFFSQQETADEKPMTPLQVLRPHHPMVLQRTVSMPHHPTLNTLHRQRAPLQHLQQSQPHPYPGQGHEQHELTSLPQYAPNSPPYSVPGGERFVPLPEQFSDLATLDQYLSTLHLQRPALPNTIPVLDQDMDLMMLSSLTLSAQDDSALMLQLNTSESSSVLSPPLSWASASPSREGSPGLSPDLQRRQISLSLPSSSVTSPLVHATEVSVTLSASGSTPGSPAPKRRRRVRPPTIKKPKKVKPTSFACMEPGCDKIFSRAYNLTSHMKTHSTERPFLCGVCHLAFARRHDRERHVRLHTGEKPYSCEVCGVGFMRNDALLRHQKLCGMAGSLFATDVYDDHTRSGNL